MKKLSLILVLTLFLGVGVAFAQTEASNDLPDPGILPDHPLYFVKSIGESFGGIFTLGQVSKIDRAVKMSEKRLAEARALSDKGEDDLASSTLDRYKKELEEVQERVDRARSNEDENVDEGLQNAIQRVASSTLKHQSVLADVYERVPEQAKSAISRAMEASSAGYENALSNMPEEARQNFRERVSEVMQRVSDKLDQLRGQGAPIPAIPAFDNEGAFPGNGNPDVENDASTTSTPNQGNAAPENAPIETPAP